MCSGPTVYLPLQLRIELRSFVFSRLHLVTRQLAPSLLPSLPLLLQISPSIVSPETHPCVGSCPIQPLLSPALSSCFCLRTRERAYVRNLAV